RAPSRYRRHCQP
ncbi:putative gp5 C-terminal domain protein, partial [Vibrio parahaemolyticus 861]